MLIVPSKLQAVDHPYLVAFSQTAVLREEGNKQGNNAMGSQCGICDDLANDVVVSGFLLKTCLRSFVVFHWL
jgi:DNA repair protein RAD16